MNNFEIDAKIGKIRTELQRLECKEYFTDRDLKEGNPVALLRICNFVLCQTAALRAWLKERKYNLRKPDAEFAQEIFRLMRDEFKYNPIIKYDQFLKPAGFVDNKLDFVILLLRFCKDQNSLLIQQGASHTQIPRSPSPHLLKPTLAAQIQQIKRNEQEKAKQDEIEKQKIKDKKWNERRIQIKEQERAKDKFLKQQEYERMREIQQAKQRFISWEHGECDFQTDGNVAAVEQES
ncbi:MAG: hypothetical protein EZS28_004532 [Streblomastix strix]|uniref:Centrosomal CEP44 domain-containing protein n=1 Tax=Streblomastix strix TaxID=222440 RepID=A0A5J4WXZ4_9EUKA|nr:MAG: hypothetical protein EZS28_004532 [Streblomastix strix]